MGDVGDCMSSYTLGIHSGKPKLRVAKVHIALVERIEGCN
jgi:hypothetical protein